MSRVSREESRQRRSEVVELRLRGFTQTEIANRLGMFPSNVVRLMGPTRVVRESVLARAKEACEQCGCPAQGADLHLHHLRYVGLTAEEYNADSNLIALCRQCHSRAHLQGYLLNGRRIARQMKVTGLRRARERKLLTQRDLAEKTGITQANISRIECGQDARISTVRKLADALNVAPTELMEPSGGVADHRSDHIRRETTRT